MKPIKITESSQLVFPCWLKFHTGAWLRFKREPAPQWLEVNCTHWHPDQPTAPSEVPGETTQEPVSKDPLTQLQVGRILATHSPDPATEAALWAEKLAEEIRVNCHILCDDVYWKLHGERGLVERLISASRTVQEPLERELNALNCGERIVLPKSRLHAEAMYSVAVASLKQHGANPEAQLSAELEATGAVEALEGIRDFLLDSPYVMNVPDHAWLPCSAALTSLTALREKLKTP